MIRSLEWDSRHFGLQIGRIDETTLNAASERAVAEELERFDCVYLLADAHDVETAERAHQLGFRMVDVRVTLGRPLREVPDAATLAHAMRPSVAADLPRLEQLAAVSYHSTRFYFDRGFARARVDELYRIWIRNEQGKPSATVWVIDDATGVAGYTSCTVRGQDSEIGLVAVDASARGTGAALSLITRSLRWAAEAGATQMSVVTQARNVAALRLYERAGFLSQSAATWYHRWRR